MKNIPNIRFNSYTDEWESYEIKELCSISTGKSNTQDKVDEGEYPFYVRSPIVEKSNKYLYDEEAVITVGDGVGTGKVFHYVKGKYDLHQRCYRMFNFNNINAKYFYYIFSTLFYKRVMAMTAKTSVDSVRLDMIAEMPIHISSLSEQQKIGTFFTNLDEIISKQSKKIEKLLTLKKSLLEKMFPKEGEDVPRLRFGNGEWKVESGKLIKESKKFKKAIYKQPWIKRKLSDIATMHARIGWQNLRTSEFLDDGDYMLITGTDFNDGSINYTTCHYVSKERYNQDKNIQIKNGSILITKDGTLGKVAYVEGLKIPATLNAGVFNIEIKNINEVDNKYLFHYLKAPFLMNYVTEKATGGTIKHLNQNILVDFPVKMPTSFVEQQKIGELFSKIDKIINLNCQKLEKIKSLKKALLAKMFV